MGCCLQEVLKSIRPPALFIVSLHTGNTKIRSWSCFLLLLTIWICAFFCQEFLNTRSLIIGRHVEKVRKEFVHMAAREALMN